jgi:pterin-4a-carbinolamine dehydratase
MIEETLKLNMKSKFYGSHVLHLLNFVEEFADYLLETPEMCNRYGKVPVYFLSRKVESLSYVQ